MSLAPPGPPEPPPPAQPGGILARRDVCFAAVNDEEPSRFRSDSTAEKPTVIEDREVHPDRKVVEGFVNVFFHGASGIQTTWETRDAHPPSSEARARVLAGAMGPLHPGF